MDTQKSGIESQVEGGEIENGLMYKTVASLVAVFFIFGGIPVPTSFAGNVIPFKEGTPQAVATVTLDQVNARHAPAPEPIPSGAAIPHSSPLAASGNTQVQATLPPGTEERGTSPNGQFKVFYKAMTASCRYFIVTDKDNNELWRFDAQGGPYNAIVSYNITNDGVYLLRYESGALKMKFADFNKKQVSDVTLPANVALTSPASVQFVSGTNRATIGTTLVDLKVGLEVRGLSPDGQHQVFYKAMTASCRYFIVTDRDYNELWRFDAQGGPYNSIVSYNVTNDGVYVLRNESGVPKIKFAEFNSRTVRDLAFPGGLSPSNIISFTFVAGTDEAYIVSKLSRKKTIKMHFNLKTGLLIP